MQGLIIWDKKMKKLFLLIFFSLIFVNCVHASSSDLFINYLSPIIYADCQGQDLQIKNNFLFNTGTGQPITNISWPYSYETLRRIIELLGEYEPFNDYASGCNGDKSGWDYGKDGCSILKCGENILDIDDYLYFWNRERIDIPQDITNIAINNQGNLVQGLSNCNIKQEQYKQELNNCTIKSEEYKTNLNNCTINFSKAETKFDWYGSISNILISLLGGFLLYLILYPKGEQKRRVKAILWSIGLFLLLLIITFLVKSLVF